MKNLHRFFFYLTILFLPTQLGRHFWPTWSSVLGRNIDYLSPTVYLTDVLIFLTLASWFFDVILSPGGSRGRRISEFISVQSRIRERFFATLRMTRQSIFILLVFFVGINVFLATNKPVAISHWLKVLEFTLFGFYIIKTKPSLSLISYLLSLAIFYSSIIAIIQFAVQHSIGGPLWFLGERTFTSQTPGIAQINWCFPNWTQCRLLLRPYATFPHPNVLGGFLATTLPLLIFNFQFLIFNQTKKFSIFKLIIIILGIVALILTFSRSAWIVGALGIGWILWNIKNQKPKIIQIIMFVGILFFLSLIAYPFGKTQGKLLSLFDPASESVVVRQQLNVAAITMWQNTPLFGVGLGNFLITLPQTFPSRAVYFLQPVHNIYLLVLSEAGFIGFLMFVLFLWQAIRAYPESFQGDKKKIISKTTHIPLISYRLSLIAYLLLGIVDHYPLTLQQGQLLFTLFLSLSLLNKSD